MLFENLSKIGDGISALQNVGKIHDIIQDYSKIDEIANIVDGLSESNVQLLLNYDKIDDFTKGIIISTSKYTDSLVLSSAAEKAATTSTFSLSSAYQGLAAKIGISTTTLGLWTAAIAAIGIAYVAIRSYNQHQEELAQAARKSAEAYASASASIDEYTQKYKALHEELTSANTTEERQYEIKKELLALQTELNDKYGDEYGRVNLVTGAYKDQTNALKGLNKALANDYLNNTPGLGMAEEEMTKERTYSLGSTGNLFDQSGQDILSVVSKYEDKGIKLTEFDQHYGVKGYNIEFRGDASQAEEVLNELASELRQLQDTHKDNNFIDRLLNSSTSSLQKNSKILTTYEQQYNQMLISQIAISDNLSGGYQQAVDAVQNYNNALASGDDKKIEESYNKLNTVKDSIDLTSDTWKKYGKILNNIFDQADTRVLDFSSELNKPGNNTLLNGLQGLPDIDAKALIEANKDGEYKELIDLANKYELSVDDIVSSLTQMKIVTESIPVNTESISKAFSKSEMISTIDELSEGFESLDKIMNSIKGDTPFDYALLNDKNFKDTFSGLGDSYTNFIDKIANSPNDIDACQSAFDDLLTTWLNSTDIIDGLSDDTKQLTIDMLSSMGVSNAEEVVTDALIEKNKRLAAEKNYNATASSALEGATQGEINRILAEADAAGISVQYLAQYALEKVRFNDIKIDTAGDIDQIISLANAAGASTKVLVELNRAKSILEQVENGTLDLNVPGNNLLVDHAKAILEQIENGTYDYGFNLDPNKFKYAVNKNNYKNETGSASNSNNSKESEEIDRFKKKIDSIAKARERLNKVIENERTPYLDQISTLNQVIKEDKKLEAAAKEAANEYQKSWESTAAKLSETDISKIMEGSLSIEEYTGPYAENLKTAQDAWSKYQDAVSQVDDYTNQTAEDIAGQFEKIRNITNASIDRIKQHVSDVQNLMDEAEAMGLYATEAQYRNLIQYADQEISKQKALRASYIRELASIAPGTEAYQKQLKAIQDCEDAISDCRQNQIKWNKSVLELPIQYINREIDGLNDDLNDLKKTQEVLDNTISGVTTHLQEQAEAQQKLRDEAEKAAQEKIDAIQAEIDGLTETNEKRKQQLDLEQKQYDLNRARNQKTNRVFREDQGDFVYEADQEAVRDAQEAYDETLFDRQISDLEDKITGIEESRDALLESYDQEIERLQEIMDSWNDISAAIERAKNIALAGSTLGAGWEDRVTSGDTSDFNHVTGEYGDNLKQQSWVEVQIEENERLIDQIEKYVEAWQLGELDIEEAYDHITAITTDIQPMMEANEQRISDLGEFSDKWSETDLNINLSLEDINAANSEAALAEGVVLDQRITKLTAFTEQYESLTSRVSAACRQIIENCRDAMDAMDEADVDEGISSGSSAAPNHDSDSDVNHGPGVYARGMENGLVHGTSSDRERENMLKYLSMTSLAKGEIPIIAHESEAILNESQQVQLLKNFDTALSYRPYSTPEQLKALDQIYRQDISAGIVQSSRSNTNSLVNQRQLENSVAVNFGDINLPQVRNADAFAKAVNSGFLGSIIQQQLYKKV